MNEALTNNFGVPMRPSASAHSMVDWATDQRNSWPSIVTTPAAVAGTHQLLGLADIEGEGLLAQDVAAGGDGFGRQGACVAGGPAMDTASRPSASASPRRGAGVRNPEALGPARRLGRVDTDEGDDVEAGLPERRDMDAGAEGGADDAGAQAQLLGRHFAGPSATGGVATGGRPTGDEVALGAELLALDIRAVARRVVGRVIGQPGCDRAADLGRGGVRRGRGLPVRPCAAPCARWR